MPRFYVTTMGCVLVRWEGNLSGPYYVLVTILGASKRVTPMTPSGLKVIKPSLVTDPTRGQDGDYRRCWGH